MGKRAGALVLACALALAPATAWAHEEQEVEGVVLEFGWETEPAYAGLVNAFEVTLLSARDRTPIDTSEALLVVEIAVGDAIVDFPLRPAGAGRVAATVLPTVAGTYTIHLTGRVGDTIVDVEARCGERTFDCVTELHEIRIPAAEAADDTLATRLDREVARLGDRLDDTSEPDLFDALSVAALLLGTGALGVALTARRRARP